MIDPALIPRIDGNMAELTAHADSLASLGTAHADIGERFHQSFQGLAAFYIAPESDQLLAASGPVKLVSASVGEDLVTAAAALRVYATDTAAIQARLETLRGEATTLVAAYQAAQDEATALTLEIRGDELSAAVAAQVAAWETAQLRCANILRSLTGAPLHNDFDTAYSSALSAIEASIAAQYGPADSVTPILPGGPLQEVYPIPPEEPLQEIYPVDETPPVNTGYPPVVVGPGPAISVPGQPGTGVIDDGPGIGVPLFPPSGPVYDADSDSGVSQGGPADDGIKPDATGKVHSPGAGLPSHVPPHWTREDLEELAEDLRASIDARNDEAARKGEDPAHRARIGQEERLLRQIEKVLRGS